MELRYLNLDDSSQIDYIHKKHFSDIEYKDFTKNFQCVFIVENDKKEIIAVGGLKPMTEAILLTNKDFSIRDRREALLKIYEGLIYAANKLGYDQIHAFSYDETYTNHLISRMGFKTINESKPLVLDLLDVLDMDKQDG